jgi:hypothetical protein
MTSSSVTVLLKAWQEHQLTNRELITEARQLTPEDRTILRVAVQQTIALQVQHAAAVATLLNVRLHSIISASAVGASEGAPSGPAKGRVVHRRYRNQQGDHGKAVHKD